MANAAKWFVSANWLVVDEGNVVGVVVEVLQQLNGVRRKVLVFEESPEGWEYHRVECFCKVEVSVVRGGTEL